MRESRGIRRTAGREIEFGEEELETSAPERGIDCERLAASLKRCPDMEPTSLRIHRNRIRFTRILRSSCEPGRELPPLLRAPPACPLFWRGGIFSATRRSGRRESEGRRGWFDAGV